MMVQWFLRLSVHTAERFSMRPSATARNVRVFGSTVRGDDGPKSDVDLLVDVEPGRSLLDVIALEQDLEELLGRRVEVLTDGGLNPYLQERILTEAQAL